MPALGLAEHVARASQLEISHRQLEPRAELRELADGREPFACDLSQDFARLIHEIRVSEPVRPADSAPQLIQLCQTESVSVEDYHGIGVRYIDPVLDDRSRNEDVGPSFDKIKHRVLECFLTHPAVAHRCDRIRHEALDRLPYLIKPRDPVVYYKYLSAARKLTLDRVPQYLLFVRSHVCVDRKPVPRRLVDDADILDARERHIQSPRYRGRRQCKNIDVLLELLQLLLVPYAESLLLVDDQKPEVFELHIVRKQSVRTYDEVDLAALHRFGRLLLRLCASESRQLLYLEREVCKTLFQIVIVLVDEKCRRCEQSRLLSFRNALEYGSRCDFCFAVSDISAQETVHRKRLLHVFLDLLDSAELIVGLGVREVLLELRLPHGVLSESITACRLPFCIQPDEILRDSLDRFACTFSLPLPAASRQTGQSRRIARVAYIFLYDVQLLGRYVQNIRACVADNEVVARLSVGSHRLYAFESADAVGLMDDVVALMKV